MQDLMGYYCTLCFHLKISAGGHSLDHCYHARMMSVISGALLLVPNYAMML